ncbi:unnamed protein product [Mycena citricolor]|uniref:Chromatin-remodeling ATPase INO80 n=1 Tax=Mycena citricolor TaxID=2018698 RepID=A0AAD2JW02_9AGAR|nr:unnamed protein product [Mycena citricolor]
MSLKRILNDEPAPGPLSYTAPRPIHVDSHPSSSKVTPGQSLLPLLGGSELPPLNQPYPQKPFPSLPSYPYPQHDWSPNESFAMEERRRREEDSEYGPQRSFSSLRSSSSEAPMASLKDPQRPLPANRTVEEAQMASDLEDFEDVWAEELNVYAAETRKRKLDVEQWYETSVLERNSSVARSVSHYYSTKMSKAPAMAVRSPGHAEESSRALSPASDHSYTMDNYAYDPPPEVYGDGYRDREYTSSVREIPRLPPPPVPVAPNKGKAKRQSKVKAETPAGAAAPPERPAKRRKVAAARVEEPLPTSDAMDETNVEWVPTPQPPFPSRATEKAREEPAQSISSISAAKAPRKKPGPKKKGFGPELEMQRASLAPSVASDVTPALSRPSSRPSSPGPIANPYYFELDEQIPPLKKAKKVDDSVMIKRLRTLEETQRKVWTNIARKDVAKVYKYHVSGYEAKLKLTERVAKVVSVQARKPFAKTNKTTKETQTKAKRLMREMQVFWKKNEREERDVRKKEHKEAMDRLKMEEEKREAARQARKLEFLISQTELYSHFVGSKLKTSEVEGEGADTAAPAGADLEDVDRANLQDIDFDDEDRTNLHLHARANAQEAMAMAKQRAQQFDVQAALDRKTNEALKLAKGQAHIHDATDETTEGASTSAPLVDLDSDELNFQNPTSLSGSLTIGQPKMLTAQLKEYQLKGLNWLATLYEQGINGILADEMGLGKTVQSISLLSYLAETHDIWGPFLVVAPASTLHNWQQELTRFVPHLKALPYWGNVKDRATLRKFWSKKEITYNKDAPFHVLITSYQLVTQDQQYFQRVNWQYMILDEAQNIKNSSSVRWKTLLGFHCRNRLLLTGTPIQNSMQELWALLHFIMPSLFDSHDEFNEWFSKDIENAAENKGSKLNEHQLRRLHMILKPFMLRRVKRHVQNELSEKIEKDIYVDLSARQRSLYKALLQNVSITDLLEKAANIGDADSARTLMNLVMQFRKVCNHPELFERADVVAPYSFALFGRPGPLNREGDFVLMPYSTRNPIEFSVPELMFTGGGLLRVPSEDSTVPSQSSCLNKLMNIWSLDWVHRSLYEEASSSFSFLRLIDSSPREAHDLHLAPLISRRLTAIRHDISAVEEAPFYCEPSFAAHQLRSEFNVPPLSSRLRCLERVPGLPDLQAISQTAWSLSCLSRPELRWFVPSVVAPPISMYCTNRVFLERQEQLLDAPLETLALFGLPAEFRDSQDACDRYCELTHGLDTQGLFRNSPSDQMPPPTMQVPEAKRLIYDSAKLAALDALLQELKTGDHRVLIYFQMTRMMDLMEEYLIYRQYKYLRLDGSSKIEDRRDMVIDWQTKPDIFVFILSTRAGGLGINLTAADTVIFYDHDWNPSNDAQAMDRAHRLGQTRQVTVYRLITKGTIDQRIVQMARVKKDVGARFKSPPDGGSAKLFNVEGDDIDDFFGHSGPSAPAPINSNENGEEENPTGTGARGKKRRGTGAPRGRKPGRKKADQ